MTANYRPDGLPIGFVGNPGDAVITKSEAGPDDPEERDRAGADLTKRRLLAVMGYADRVLLKSETIETDRPDGKPLHGEMTKAEEESFQATRRSELHARMSAWTYTHPDGRFDEFIKTLSDPAQWLLDAGYINPDANVENAEVWRILSSGSADPAKAGPMIKSEAISEILASARQASNAKWDEIIARRSGRMSAK